MPKPQQYCLITGCSRGGIDYTLAEQFSKAGLHVFATARMSSKVTGLQDNRNITILPLDVTNDESIAACLATVTQMTGGKLDYLANNSGSQYVMSVLDLDIKKARDLFDVNVWGAVAMCKKFGPLVIAAKASIVDMGSIAGLIYPPFMGKLESQIVPETKPKKMH